MRGARPALALLFVAALAGRAFALAVPPKPANGLADPDVVLAPATRAELERQLVAYAQGTTARYGVAIFKSLESESVEDFSMRIAEAWKIGSKKESNGVLLTIFLTEHKLRIDVGYGLEAKLPDALCARIIREEIGPKFRAGDLQGGIGAGLAAIDRAATGRAALVALVAAAPVQPEVPTPEVSATAPYVPRDTYRPHVDPPEAADSSFIWIMLGLGAVVGAFFLLVNRLSRRPGDIGPGSSGGWGGGMSDGGSSWSSSPSDSGSSSEGSSDSWSSSDSSGGSFGGGGASGDW